MNIIQHTHLAALPPETDVEMLVVPTEVNQRPHAGTLYLIPVPLSDGTAGHVLPAYNVEIVRGIRHFVVENLRSARRFLRVVIPDFPIDECTFVELSEHTPVERVDAMLTPCRRGCDLGVISEAGCPAVADPGAAIVAAAQQADIPVIPLVGPSSILMSLMASGFNGQNFAFQGYLPVDEGKRTARLKELERAAAHGQTQIFIETPYRNNRLLQRMAAVLSPSTLICVAADITGPRQSILTRPASVWRTAVYDYNKVPTIFLIGAPVIHA